MAELTHFNHLGSDLQTVFTQGLRYNIRELQFYHDQPVAVLSDFKPLDVKGVIDIPLINTTAPFTLLIRDYNEFRKICETRKLPPSLHETGSADLEGLHTNKGRLEIYVRGARVAQLDKDLFFGAFIPAAQEAIARVARSHILIHDWMERTVEYSGPGRVEFVSDLKCEKDEDSSWSGMYDSKLVIQVLGARPEEIDSPVPPSSVDERGTTYIFA